MLTHNTRQTLPQTAIGRGMLESIGGHNEDESNATGPRIPPPVQPSQGAPLRRDTQPSVSIEQAAKPTFEISVGDPHKVGDLTSSHIVYLVKTKVIEAASALINSCLIIPRLPPKRTGNPSLKLPADIVISYGCTTDFMGATQGS